MDPPGERRGSDAEIRREIAGRAIEALIAGESLPDTLAGLAHRREGVAGGASRGAARPGDQASTAGPKPIRPDASSRCGIWLWCEAVPV
jgi:hypothetical protein